MNSFDDVVRDLDGVIVAGASVYVYSGAGTLADLYASDGVTPVANPLTSDDKGYFKAWAADGFYTLEYYWGGRKRYVNANRLVGTAPLDTAVAETEADRADTELYMQMVALMVAGIIFTSTAGGIAGTVANEFFIVITGGTAKMYVNDAGVAVQIYELPSQAATDAAIAAATANIRPKLTASRTYYVRTNGSDSNDGLADTAGGAFLTLQKAINAAYALDCNGFNVTIQIADGTYTGGMLIFGKLAGAFDNGNQPLRIIGNEGTPGNVIINPTNADAVRIGDKATALLAGVRLRTTTSGSAVNASNGAYLEIRNVDFGTCATETIQSSTFATVRAIGPVSVSGASSSFVHATKRSLVSFSDQTLTFTGAPAFGTYLWGINDASIHLDSGTIVGTATGGITVHINGVLQVSSVTGVWTGGVEPSVLTGGRIIAEDKMQLRTFYVRTDGNDTNSGFGNTAAQAFLTIQGAVNRLAKMPYDEAGYVASSDPDAGWKITVGAGAFAEEVILRECRFFGVTIEGAGTGSTSTVSFTSKALNTTFNIRQMAVGGAGKTALSAYRGSEIGFENVKFVASTAFGIAENGARIIATGNFEIAGASSYAFISRLNSTIDMIGRTVTITGTPALGTFATVEHASVLRAQGCTFTGSATGTRYDVRTNGVIETNGGGATFLPGGTAGATATGGQYV